MRIPRIATLVLSAAMALLPLAHAQKSALTPLSTAQKVKSQPASEAATPAPAPQKPAAKAATSAAGSQERRDPFKSVIQEQKPGTDTQPTCPPGPQGILVGQAELSGIVRAPSGYIAVVNVRSADRTYFIRENQKVCNGRVARITPDSIVFEEDVIDPMGKMAKREVIRKIPAEAK